MGDFVRIPECDFGVLGGIIYISAIGRSSTQAVAISRIHSALTLPAMRWDPAAIVPSRSAWTRDLCPPMNVHKREASFLSVSFTGLRGNRHFLFFAPTILGTFSPEFLSISNLKRRPCTGLSWARSVSEKRMSP